jgi:hypothetical protein
MAIDYSVFAGIGLPKGRPRAATKKDRDAQLEKEERAARQAVDRRDGRRCFFPACKHYATDKHHIRSSSLRGKRVWVTADLLSACGKHHRWFKAGLIGVTGNPDIQAGQRGALQVYVTKLGLAEGITLPA